MEKDKFDMLWKQFEFNANLYKFYFELFLKFNLFYYAMTSGIVAYAILNQEENYTKYLLFIPVLTGSVFLILVVYGSFLIKNIGVEIKELSEELKLESYPDTTVLIVLFIFAAILYILISYGIYHFFV